MSKFSSNAVGRHEDAQEFLHYLIDNLHEELVQLREGRGDKPEPSGAGFVLVSSKRNCQVVISLEETLVSQIFGGRLRCGTSQSASRPVPPRSRQDVPFFSLQLPIEPIRSRTLSNAFEMFVAPEMISGIRKGHKLVNVFQTSIIHALPLVLILHVKRSKLFPQHRLLGLNVYQR